MTNTEKQEMAHELYMKSMPSHEIARILKTTTTTVSAWTKKGNWKTKRIKYLAKKKARIEMFGDIVDYELEAIYQLTQENREKAETENVRLPQLGSKVGDTLVKIYGKIQGLDLEWGTYVDILREFGDYIKKTSPDLARAITPFVDEFLASKRDSDQQ